jgi:hypothetical protein
MNIKRWVWLEIAVLPANKEPEMNPAFNRYYIPEAVIDSIPDYQIQLFDELAAIEAEGGEEPVVCDNCPRDLKIVTKAIRFLTSGHLTPPDQRCKGPAIRLYILAVWLRRHVYSCARRSSRPRDAYSSGVF